jgi:hypothetical protein
MLIVKRIIDYVLEAAVPKTAITNGGEDYPKQSKGF